jgi:hypothetical protein
VRFARARGGGAVARRGSVRERMTRMAAPADAPHNRTLVLRPVDANPCPIA